MNYAKLQATANAQLADKGQLVTITRYAPSRNPTTGAVTEGPVVVTGSAYAVEVPVTQGLIQSFGISKDKEKIQIRKAFKVSALLGFFPQPDDRLTMNDATVWPVVGATQANPAGTPITYTVGVTK